MDTIVSILGNFGVSWTQLIENSITFILLAVLLTVFLYRPVLKMLEKRKQMVEQAVKDSEDVAKKKDDMQKEYRKTLNQANRKSKELIEQAMAQSQVVAEKISAEAKADALVLIEKAKEEIANEKAVMYDNLKADISSLIAVTLKKVLSESLTADEQQRILTKALKDINT